MGSEGTLKRDEGQGLPAGREEGEGRRSTPKCLETSNRALVENELKSIRDAFIFSDAFEWSKRVHVNHFMKY